MAVELILFENVDHLGVMGEVVKVADGYARNYLVPRGLATKASPNALRKLEAKKIRCKHEQQKLVEDLQKVKELIDSNSVNIPMQAAENGKLYGSVTAQHIVDALKEMKIEIEKKQVALLEPIRKLDTYSVDILLHSEVTATLKVWVIPPPS